MAKKLFYDGHIFTNTQTLNVYRELKQLYSQKKIKNLETLHVDLEKKSGSKLKDSLIDRAIISNILFMISDRKAFLKEANRILKDGGKVLFVDFDPNSPILKNTKHKTLTQNEARKLFEEASFVYERDFMTGEHHYGMIFTKPIKK
jgi:ubiquinone/menaquinone biosynthesis C-methylase UbiE